MKRKLLSLLFILCVTAGLVGALSVTAFAEILEGDCGAQGNNVRYRLDTETGVLTISGSGEMADYNEPPAPWMEYKSLIKNAVIENGVTSIGKTAFNGCIKLFSITIPNSITSIQGWAFNDCRSLSQITIPDSVTYIGEGTFNGCASISSITIPRGITAILAMTFQSCENLESIALPESILTIDKWAFNSCQKLSSIVIPDNVTKIGNSAFDHNLNLKTIILPKSLKDIGDEAFSEDNCLEKVIYSGTEEEFSKISVGTGNEPLTNKLKYSTISGNCGENIQWDFFSDSGMLVISGKGDIPKFEEKTPWNEYIDSITDIIIKEGITGLSDAVFNEHHNVKSIVLPNSMTNLATWAFNSCDALTQINIPNNIKEIGYGLFNGCNSLTSIVLPKGITNINIYAFQYCSNLTEIYIPDSVMFISGWAFNRCTSLASITLPKSLQAVGSNAFDSCSALTEAIYQGTEAEFNNKVSVNNENAANNTLINVLKFAPIPAINFQNKAEYRKNDETTASMNFASSPINVDNASTEITKYGFWFVNMDDTTGEVKIVESADNSKIPFNDTFTCQFDNIDVSQVSRMGFYAIPFVCLNDADTVQGSAFTYDNSFDTELGMVIDGTSDYASGGVQ